MFELEVPVGHGWHEEEAEYMLNVPASHALQYSLYGSIAHPGIPHCHIAIPCAYLSVLAPMGDILKLFTFNRYTCSLFCNCVK
jgi:hypothetical protein